MGNIGKATVVPGMKLWRHREPVAIKTLLNPNRSLYQSRLVDSDPGSSASIRTVNGFISHTSAKTQ